MDTKQSLAAIWQAKFGPVEVPDTVLAALENAYLQGFQKGLLQAAAAAFATQGQAEDNRRSERHERFAQNLPRARRVYPEIDFDKPVMIKRTPYRITGYNPGAPKHAFIITGPQGGVYKCPKEMIVREQQ